jgi:tetrapyrrole methylase family protein / MazG family protein
MPRRKTNRKRTKQRSSRQPFVAPSHAGRDFQKLAAVMARLRSPNGCPWDRQQNHSTLRTYLIEESYEVLDAMDSADDAKFAEELGDLLLQVLFHAQIAKEEGRFDITGVIREIYEKMIRRHPHVFGQKRAKNAAEVLRNWEKIKAQERKTKQTKEADESRSATPPNSSPESLLDGVPRSLPALLEACQLTRKAARIGFDWDSISGIFEKLEEEIAELREALRATPPDSSRIEGELGDLLFVGVNLARFLQLDPEIALKKTTAKFSRRFRHMEQLAREQGSTLAQVPRGQMEALWDQAKLNDKQDTA